MSAKDFSLAIGEIDDKYITEAISYQCQKKKRFVHFRRWTSIAACFLLAAFLTGCAILTFSVEARAAFFGWVRQQYENFYEYFFEGDAAVTTPVKYELGWMPEGCEYVDTIETDSGKILIYTDSQDMLIRFSYDFPGNSGSLGVDGVNYIQKSVKVNGASADLYIAPTEDETSSIVWTNANNDLFTISGPFDEDTLIRMAESVQVKPVRYELGYMPEGIEFVYFGETVGGEVYIYKDEQGAMIEFYYISEPDYAKMYIDSVENETDAVKINGYPGEYSVTPSESETDHIIWTDTTRNVLFYISGHFDKDTFIRMAESVQIKEE